MQHMKSYTMHVPQLSLAQNSRQKQISIDAKFDAVITKLDENNMLHASCIGRLLTSPFDVHKERHVELVNLLNKRNTDTDELVSLLNQRNSDAAERRELEQRITTLEETLTTLQHQHLDALAREADAHETIRELQHSAIAKYIAKEETVDDFVVLE